MPSGHQTETSPVRLREWACNGPTSAPFSKNTAFRPSASKTKKKIRDTSLFYSPGFRVGSASLKVLEKNRSNLLGTDSSVTQPFLVRFPLLTIDLIYNLMDVPGPIWGCCWVRHRLFDGSPTLPKKSKQMSRGTSIHTPCERLISNRLAHANR